MAKTVRKPKATTQEAPAIKGKTRIIQVIDRSGSMGHSWEETVNGINFFIEEQKALGDDATVSLSVFDTQVDHLLVQKALADVPDMKIVLKNHGPRGSTALFDAISKTVGANRDTVGPEDRAVLQIVTDGYENASRETTKEAVMALIKELESTGRWTVTYMSASPTAWEDAVGLGISRGNTATYDASVQGSATMAFASNSAGTANLRSGIGGQSMNFYSNTPARDDADGPGSANKTEGKKTE